MSMKEKLTAKKIVLPPVEVTVRIKRDASKDFGFLFTEVSVVPYLPTAMSMIEQDPGHLTTL